MPKKKSPKKKCSALTVLQKRVSVLEQDFHTMKTDVGHLTEELAVVKISMKHIDERTRRGEVVLLEMQGEQRKISRSLDRLLGAQGLPPEPTPVTQVPPADED